MENRKIVARLLFLLPAMVSLLVLWRNYSIPGVTSDSTIFLQIARNLLLGHGLGWQAAWVPPFHSILLAVASWAGGFDLLHAAAVIGTIQAFLLVVVVYFFALSVFDQRTAVVAAVMTAVFPHLVWLAFYPESEITYTFLQIASLFAFFAAIRKGSHVLGVLAGVLFAFAYMARSEGLFVMAFVILCVLVAHGKELLRSRVIPLCTVIVLVFILVASPYLFFLRQHYGGLVLSPKTSYVLVWMQGRIYQDHDKGEMENEDLWGLTPDGKLRWMEPKGLGYLVSYLLSDPSKSLRVYSHNLSMHLPGRIPNNSGMERYPQVFPVYFAVLAAVAAFSRWKGSFRGERAVLLAPFLVMLILPVFTEGWWRYLVPYLPLLLILAARGLWIVAEWGAKKVLPDSGRAAHIIVILVTLALGGYFLAVRMRLSVPAPITSELSARRSLAEEQKSAGQWARRRFGPGHNYMSPWSKIVYHLDGLWTALPVASLPEILSYGRANGAEYLVVEMRGETLDDRALGGMVPTATFAGVYRSSTSPYAAAFYLLSH